MNEARTDEKAVIIGCGIAGPVLALFLQRAGITPLVYEGRPTPDDEAGYFLNLAPNGLAVLETLGIKDDVIARGTPTTSIIFQNHRGKQLAKNPETTLLIKRDLLTKALREAVTRRGIPIAYGKRLTDVEITSDNAARARFEDGSEARGDMLVGCDGIHSRTRRSILPDAPPPSYLGVIDSGAFTRSASVPKSEGDFRMTFGTEGFFGYQKAPSGEIYWFENFTQKVDPNQKQLQAISNDAWRKKLLDIHQDDPAPIAEIIRSTEGEIGKWPNSEVPPLPTWHKGPVGLIGDAAHAMSPSTGQGAAMAMEDAIVLAKCLRDISNVEDAFAAFERLRKDRVEKIAKDARRNSNQKGSTNVLTRWVRDLVLPFFLKMGVKSAKQTYAYRVDWNEKVKGGETDLSRRTLLKKSIFAASGALIGGTVATPFVHRQFEEPTLVNEGMVFKNELHIPPLAESIQRDGQTVFNLTLQKGTTEFFSGRETATWGVNGSYLGPTLRAERGDDVLLRVTNRLGKTTTNHWHGMHLPAAMDGGPHQPIAPGQTWQPRWTIDQQAATLWYHPHLMGETAEHVYRGLGGLFILEDENSSSLALPNEYGVDDLPLIVQDRAFDDEGQFVYQPNDNWLHGMGMFGDTILVNGTYAPYVEVPAKKVRLRILNASNARRYRFGFADGRAFYQIASGGGLLEEPFVRTRMVLAPGERAEIIVDLSRERAPVTLLSYAIVDGENVLQNFVEGLSGLEYDENERFKILELRPQPTVQADPPLPETLAALSRWREEDAVNTRRFVLGTGTINGKKMDMERIDEVVRVGDVEIWEITNPSATYHPFHVHDVQFQILERNGKPPAPHERGWKDTVIVSPDETVRVIMHFSDYTDPDLPYMYHCHILEHEDMGMMGQFVVVE